MPDDATLQRQIDAVAKRYRKRDRQQHRIRIHLREYASAKEACP